MKLNYKRTILVGFAFFLISAFWQAYDQIVPLILTNHYGLSQALSGAVMSLDNVLAVFLLPLFGALSDKVFTRWGKRTPFIFVGTILAVVAFISLTFIDNSQYKTVINHEIGEMTYEEAYLLEDNVDEVDALVAGADGEALTKIVADEKAALADLYAAKDIPSQYKAVESFRKAAYSLMSEARSSGRSDLVGMAESQLDIVDDLFEDIADTTYSVTKSNILPLVFFVLMLLLVLVSMAIFRSPAVALMPDVTVKPLRSKGNAIINLMGTAGGIIVLVLGMIFATKEIYMQYTWYVVAVCAVMLAGLGIFIFTVKERLWADEMLADTEKLEAATETAELSEGRKLSKPELKSLILILASVALWYIGYNSITSKYSVYATRELGFDPNFTLIVAQAAAVITYIPVGIIASKIGRRKTILAGIVMLASAFLAGNFITPLSPEFLMYPVFVLAGIGWATINVNSFPMVVELAKGGDVGKYTGYYYTASMAAQIVAPNLSGILYDLFSMRTVFFIFGTVFVALSFVTMFFVKHGDAKAEQQSMLEALAGAED